MVERLLPKQDIVGSSPITRSLESRSFDLDFSVGPFARLLLCWVFPPNVESDSEQWMPDNITVLYVEDNQDNRSLIRRVLEAEGYSVLEAATARLALTRLQERKPDLILMDINMPDMDGYALTAHIRSIPELARVPIVAVTANVMRGDREKSLQAGCDGYIQKPIDIDELPRQVERFIRTAHA